MNLALGVGRLPELGASKACRGGSSRDLHSRAPRLLVDRTRTGGFTALGVRGPDYLPSNPSWPQQRTT
jgi:hypothetical protein